MQNAIRTGVDIVELHQIVEEMNRNPDFAYDLLTKDEMKLYQTLEPAAQPGFLAGRLAAKEAVLKSIGAKKKLRYDDVEILPDGTASPLWFTASRCGKS